MPRDVSCLLGLGGRQMQPAKHDEKRTRRAEREISGELVGTPARQVYATFRLDARHWFAPCDTSVVRVAHPDRVTATGQQQHDCQDAGGEHGRPSSGKTHTVLSKTGRARTPPRLHG